ncbi:Hypothetical protein FKW44_014088 [Caligus rogercresseyi]|uniref:Uncharacterized protein n=1 Tax=Caligus rogercresseyi TaxID=217165 RepID=A0A7T8GYE1_CALRO|nr:Hypothetical protein FKW44_014088 [Caligus rogercresseyi]
MRFPSRRRPHQSHRYDLRREKQEPPHAHAYGFNHLQRGGSPSQSPRSKVSFILLLLFVYIIPLLPSPS